jgi:hypothetical protein
MNTPRPRPRFATIRNNSTNQYSYYDIVDHGDGTQAERVLATNVKYLAAVEIVAALNYRQEHHNTATPDEPNIENT